MRFKRTTNKFLENELYKLFDSTETRQILGEYDQRSTWEPSDIYKRLMHVCLEKTSLEDICSTTEGPSADTVHRRISGLKMTQIEQYINCCLFEVVSRLKFHHKSKITLAFDLYEQPFYGNTSYDWVIGTERKKGTNYAITFLIVSIATRNIRCPVSVCLMTSRRKKYKVGVISRILDDLFPWLPIKRCLFDRGFCQDDIIQLMDDRNLEYVFAAIRHGSVKKASKEIHACVKDLANQAGVDVNDRLALGQWARKNSLDTFRVEHVATGRRRKRVPLVGVFVRKKTKDKNPLKRRIYCLYIYLTNCKVSPRTVVKLYSKRWIVETDIRCVNEFKPITNSIRPQLRLFLYGLAVILDALWVVFSTLINRLKENNNMHITEEAQFIIKQADVLQCIARYFLRLLRTEIFPLLNFRGGVA